MKIKGIRKINWAVGCRAGTGSNQKTSPHIVTNGPSHKIQIYVRSASFGYLIRNLFQLISIILFTRSEIIMVISSIFYFIFENYDLKIIFFFFFQEFP